MDCEKIVQDLSIFIQEQIKKANAKGVVIGLSGGVDSALVAKLCKLALKNDVFALLMPSSSSNKENLNDALMLCKDLQIKHKLIMIDEILNAFLKCSQNPNQIRTGNFAARIRMSLLYDYSALRNSLVVGTSNKSELLLGYGTIYGDLACAFNPVADLFKSEIYTLARFLNLHSNFLQKAPSADLWEGQSDEGDLGFSYEKIDEGLKALLNDDKITIKTLDENLIFMLKKRMQSNAFKRKMPIFAKLDLV